MVSIIIVTRNESDYIEDCLASVVAQIPGTAGHDVESLSTSGFELIIVDGMSVDGTLDIAKEWCRKHDIDAVFLRNPHKTLATGWNLGIRNSQGDFLIRPDAHATLHPGYIQACIKALERFPEAGAAGGRLETKSKGRVGAVIAKVLSSKVGVGNSSFRTSKSSGFQDTAVYGVYRRKVFETVDLFNEGLTRHQDTEFHQRMKEAGFKFYFEAEAVADYYCRRNISSLASQYFHIGFYLPDLVRTGHSKAIRPRHMAPAAFYVFCISLVAFGCINNISYYAGWFFFGIYLSILALESVRISISERKIIHLSSFFIFLLVHISYAAGTLAGFLKVKK